MNAVEWLGILLAGCGLLAILEVLEESWKRRADDRRRLSNLDKPQ